MKMSPPPEPVTARREEQDQQDQQEQQDEQEKDFFFASNTFKAIASAKTKAVAKAKAVAKDETKCDTANVKCALLFQIIPLIFHHDGEESFKFVTPIYAAHIMLNVKRKSLLYPSSSSSSSSLSSPNNNRSHKDNDNDDESNTYVKMAACASAVWTCFVWSNFNPNDGFMEVMSAVWITGSIFNLQFLTRDINSVQAFAFNSQQIKPLFLTLSLLAGRVANILCLMAVVMGEYYYNDEVGYDTRFVRGEMPHVLLTIGLIVYIIHTILFGLSICFGHILFKCFSDKRLLAVLWSRGNEGEPNNDDDDICRRLRKDDIITVPCLFLMPVFIFAGTGVNPVGYVAMGLMGSVLYLSCTTLEMRRRKANEASSDITSRIRMGKVGMMLWILFLFCIGFGDLFLWFGLIFLMIGCLCNLFIITSDLGKLTCTCRDGQTRPIFKVLFVWTTLAANILIAIGAGISVVSQALVVQIVGFGLIVIGSVLFFIQPFFLALSIICGHIVFSIHIATPVPESLGDQPGVEEFVIPSLDKKMMPSALRCKYVCNCSVVRNNADLMAAIV